MISVLAFFVLICVLVFVHEYGHFWAARRCGVSVKRFSIGFGKVLWRKKDRSGTEFVFSLIPLGGYVQMKSERESGNDKSGSLEQKSRLQRAFIVVAGPIANFIFAIAVYWIVFIIGIPTAKPVIGEVIPNSIAAKAILPSELHIRKVDGRSVYDWEETILILISKVGSEKVGIEGHLIDDDHTRSYELDLRHWKIDGSKENPLTTLGIRPKSVQVEPIIQKVAEHSAAQKAGLQIGDEIVKINQRPFDWQQLIDEVQTGKSLSIEYKRGDLHHIVQITPEKSADKDKKG